LCISVFNFGESSFSFNLSSTTFSILLLSWAVVLLLEANPYESILFDTGVKLVFWWIGLVGPNNYKFGWPKLWFLAWEYYWLESILIPRMYYFIAWSVTIWFWVIVISWSICFLKVILFICSLQTCAKWIIAALNSIKII